MHNGGDTENKKTKIEEFIDYLKRSGLEVTNATKPRTGVGIAGGVRRPRESTLDRQQTAEKW
jgi:hypothetical protein